jgi:hypothetical protein
MHESLFGQELKQLWGELRWDGQFARGLYRGLEIHINTDWLDKGIKIAVKHPEGLNPWNKVVGIDVKTVSTEMQAWIDSKLWDAQEIKALKEGRRYRLRDCRNGAEWVSICVGVYEGDQGLLIHWVAEKSGRCPILSSLYHNTLEF